MTILRETIDVPRPPEEAFDAVVDFSSAEVWDPGVVTAERVQEGEGHPSGIGARYRLTVTFRGAESEMTYVTTEYSRPTRVVLVGEGDRITATDTIEFEPTDAGGTRISYEADLRLKGLAKVAQPLLGKAFDEMGRRAIEGMRAWFEAGSIRT
ncbi:MAG: SRPBCC family protein [Actinomycetota bacterium]|nr:SRPBCC family protein [Actinomycetota bacterium]MDH5225047.1 SRPBCC family protein [Actinomycetota bacterium]MDH5313887.1 SRPBCC family protein [Actinomycetota bacterium]